MAVISMKQLLEAGVHFGHQTRRWNPKMKKYIFTERNGIYIIDLQKTVKLVDAAYDYMKNVAEEGGVALFVGTKTSQEAIKKESNPFRSILRKPSLVRWNVDELGNYPKTCCSLETNQQNGRRWHI